MKTLYETARDTLIVIESIASGSTTANSLPNLARIAREGLVAIKTATTTHHASAPEATQPAAAEVGGLTATHGPLHLTNRKTADIAGRGYNIVGYVLRRKDGEEVCISAESAVRWLPQPHYWRLMHEQDGSLFAARAPHQEAEGSGQDAARLNWMVSEECYFDTMLSDGKPFYRLYWPHLGEAQSEWFPEPRNAIDSAMSVPPATKTDGAAKADVSEGGAK